MRGRGCGDASRAPQFFAKFPGVVRPPALARGVGGRLRTILSPDAQPNCAGADRRFPPFFAAVEPAKPRRGSNCKNESASVARRS